MTGRTRKKPIVAVYWSDAVYTHDIEFPRAEIPVEHVTFGVILERDSKHIVVGMNCRYDEKRRALPQCIDTLLIPRRAIQRIEQLGVFALHHE